MLQRMTLMFGQDWWDYVVIGVSFWKDDEASIDHRKCDPDFPEFCQDEEWFESEISRQINEKFHVNRTFTFVFTDSWSQTAGPPNYNTDDPLHYGLTGGPVPSQIYNVFKGCISASIRL